MASPSSPPPARVLEFGPQRVAFTAPDNVLVTMTDPVIFSDIVALIDALHAVREREGRLFATFDVTHLRTVPRSVRLGRERVVASYSAVAFVGASFSVRVVAEMLIRAVRVLSPQKFAFPFAFVDDRAAAAAWMEARRRALLQESTGPTSTRARRRSP